MTKAMQNIQKQAVITQSRVLSTVAHSYSLDGALRESYIKAANSIQGEFERNRALAAV
jgi:hypothetical protein